VHRASDDGGHGSNYHDGHVANHVYFAALLEPAIWGAELAVALGDGTGSERIYIVEPTGGHRIVSDCAASSPRPSGKMLRHVLA
jgi:hypothetical protein